MRALLVALVLLAAGAAAAQPQPWGTSRPFNGSFGAFPADFNSTFDECTEALSARFQGDPNLGFQRSAADSLLICANDIARLTLSSTASTVRSGSGDTFELVSFGGTSRFTFDTSGTNPILRPTSTSADLLLRGGTASGSLLFSAGDNVFEIREDDGTTIRGTIQPSSTFGLVVYRGGNNTNSTDAQLQLCSNGTCSTGEISMGARADNGATTPILTIHDDINSSADNHWQIFGGGLVGGAIAQTCDCGTTGTPNTVTCDIQNRHIILTDGDADNCTVTFATTSADALDRWLDEVIITVDNNGGGGTFNLSDQSGIMELDEGAPFIMDLGDQLVAAYRPGALDSYAEKSRMVGASCTGTVSSNAVTCNGTSGVITDDGTDINASTTRADITWTNNRITATSIVTLSNCKKTADANVFVMGSVTRGAGTATLSIRNVGTGNLTSLNDAVLCFTVDD